MTAVPVDELLWTLNDVERKFAPDQLFAAGEEDERSVDLLCEELPLGGREHTADVPF